MPNLHNLFSQIVRTVLMKDEDTLEGYKQLYHSEQWINYITSKADIQVY